MASNFPDSGERSAGNVGGRGWCDLRHQAQGGGMGSTRGTAPGGEFTRRGARQRLPGQGTAERQAG
jgi:hypothetical protein